ncbi:hypothetical protein OF829_12330 [Sphingomonas sp. LB-2]|uniref:hypothetical protein n=1 Tax=Sphingomonas caeni TaxID=2984949 RepID=UPI00222E2C13|nr:hypothetical protein [Sphingomonas caeni]MCW3848028.1 hypothetical protein [Sphingomonas caeni]
MKLAAWLALAALAAWLWSPALHPVHVEGFSASIVALGVHLAQGTLADFFPSQPLNAEYLGLTKLGAVLGIAGLVKLGLTGEAAMRLLMAAGGLLLVGGSARLVRYWTGAPWLLAAAVLLLIPGIAESHFFFNDNVPAAGLLIAALALFCDRQTALATIATGVLIGLAIAVRTDLILVAPAIFLIAWERQPLRQAILATAIAAGSAIATLWIIYAIVGASPLDALRIGAVAVDLWDRPGDFQRQFQSLLLFLGLPALVLYLFGLVAEASLRDWKRLALLLGIPLFMNLALAGKLWEVRQLLPLTPFLAAIAARGALKLIADWKEGRRVPPAIIAAAMLAILIAPPAIVYPADGPRAVIGRVTAIPLWWDWQARVRGNFALLDRLIADGTPIIVTDYWDEDRYLHLRLVEQGYRAGPQIPACAAIGQSMSKDGRTILQLSPHQTFLPNAGALYTPRLAELALPCLRAAGAKAILVTDSGRAARLLHPETAPRMTRPRDATFAAIPATPEILTRLGEDHREEGRTAPPGRYHTVQAARQATRPRTDFTK